jgi:hypothetical protein
LQTVALIAILTMNEIVWHSLVSLFFGSSPVRRLSHHQTLDRSCDGSVPGHLGLRLLWQASETAGGQTARE